MGIMRFGIQSQVVFEVFTGIVLLAELIERALAIGFEWQLAPRQFNQKELKKVITCVVTFSVVFQPKSVAIAINFILEKKTYLRFFLVALTIARNFKGSIPISPNYQNWRSSTATSLN